MSVHTISRTQVHQYWDNRPIISVKSGDTISFDCLDASGGVITPTVTKADLALLSLSGFNKVNGPVHVEGAAPGDTLQVDVIDIETADWGWTAILSGFGLLADEFPEQEIKVWKLNKSGEEEKGYGYAWFDEGKGIKIPLKPFSGEMGVAPEEKGQYSTIPPYATGGNIDLKHLTAGSTVYLPVKVDGGLFSIGDGHAAQGDGEVCGTAIETPTKVTVRLTVLKNKPYVQTPHYHISKVADESGEFYGTTGVAPDIREATRDAVRNMIKYLEAEHGLTRTEAYMLCSVAGDLRMHEVVDMPNYLIGMMIPKPIFGHRSS
ncbi:Formamidase [Cristinia sonorae]|uniref:Formamidase n=1 Tax=Cristinia sonorae TaxID=1940300 RepID=A0A8K0UI61_9AGAR|nr:Formamidase [Cristinia sonorae]